MFIVVVVLLLVTLLSAAVWMLRRGWSRSAPASSGAPAKVLAAGWVLLLVLIAAASQSLLPFQLDDAGRQACALTLGRPGPEQREDAVALAERSDVGGLREAAGPGTPPTQRYDSVERWCSSND